MFSFNELSRKQKFIIVGSIISIIIFITILIIVNSRRSQIPPTPNPQPSTPYIPITPRDLQESGGSGSTGGGIPRRPTQTPEQQENELQARTPIIGQGFLMTYNETTGSYDVFITEPFETSQEEVLLWIADQYPLIPLSKINFEETSSSVGQLPFKGNGFTITTGSTNNSYTVYITNPDENIQNEVEQILSDTGILDEETEIEYVPVAEQIPSPTLAQPPGGISITPTNRPPQDSSGPSDNTSEQTSSEILDDFFNIFNPGDISTITLEDSLNPTVGVNPDGSPSTPTGLPTDISVSPAPIIAGILGNTNLPYSAALKNSLSGCLSNKSIYQVASSYTGIPWEVLAGIHYTETGGSCSRNKSLVSGRTIGVDEPDVYGKCSSQDSGLGKPNPGGYDPALGRQRCIFEDLLDTAVYAGNHLKTKNPSGGPPRNHQELVRMVSHYNGGGNQNCRGGTPYRYCPPLFYAEDDTYVFNKNPDGRHEVMYIRFCADHKTCAELGKPNPVHQVYGVLTIAGAISTL